MKRILLLLFLLVAVAAYAYPPLRHAGLQIIGRGQGCSLTRALDLDAHWKRIEMSKDRILAASKLIRKDEKGLQLWQTPYGEFWTPEGSDYILPFNLAEQEQKIYGSGERAVQKGDVVLDCGANVGVFTREALAAGASKVIAIEPAPDNIECLRRTFAKEIEAGSVVVYPKGVWDKDDVLEFRVDPKNQAADSFVIHRQGADQVMRLPLTSIDKMVAELGLPKVDYIKMDIEGAEVKALQGAKETLGRWHPRMSLSTYHQADHPVEVPKAAREGWNGYRTECGPCNHADGKLRPEIVYFY